MKAYKVITDHQLSSLERKVENALAEGWQPCGGISMRPAYSFMGRNYAEVFAQAVVR